MRVLENNEQVKNNGIIEYNLSDNEISRMLEKLIFDKMEGWRQRSYKRWSQWINPDVMAKISDEKLKENFLDYYNNLWATLNPVNRDRIIRNVQRFREMMLYLLDENIDIKKRFNKTVPQNGKYHITGAGKSLISSFLMHLNLDKYTIWNNKTEDGLKALGRFPKRERGEDVGTTYLKIIDAVRKIRELKPELSFLGIDHFLHIVAVVSMYLT